MHGHKRKRHTHHPLADAKDDPLKTIQRQDGLWESIEHGQDILLDSEGDTNPPHTARVKHEQLVPRRSATLPHIQQNSIGTQTSPAVPAAVTCVFPAGNQPSSSSPASIATQQPLTAPPRRRGRPPKKKTNEPSVHRRHVRFTDPDPSDCGRSKAAHVFVRLHKVLVSLDGGGSGGGSGGGDGLQQPDGTPSRATSNSCPRQVEFVWNNRAKAWKLSGHHDSEGMVELHGLLDQPPERLGIVRPFVSSVEKNGVRQPVTFLWDAATFSFQGVNEDNEVICITLGEMKDMARDPWGRQYVGYIVG